MRCRPPRLEGTRRQDDRQRARSIPAAAVHPARTWRRRPTATARWTEAYPGDVTPLSLRLEHQPEGHAQDRRGSLVRQLDEAPGEHLSSKRRADESRPRPRCRNRRHRQAGRRSTHDCKSFSAPILKSHVQHNHASAAAALCSRIRERVAACSSCLGRASSAATPGCSGRACSAERPAASRVLLSSRFAASNEFREADP